MLCLSYGRDDAAAAATGLDGNGNVGASAAAAADDDDDDAQLLCQRCPSVIYCAFCR